MKRNDSAKYTLLHRIKRQDGSEELMIGRSFVWLVWVILAFVLILLGRSIAGFHHLP